MKHLPYALRTERLELHPAAPADVPALLKMRDASSASDANRDERVRALAARNAADFKRDGFGLWLVSHEGRPVGFVGLRPRESALEPELYYGLAPEARGHGIATEAADVVLAWLFAKPEVRGVWAVTDPTNLASCRVLERLGMKLESEGEFDGMPSRVYRRMRVAAGKPHRR